MQWTKLEPRTDTVKLAGLHAQKLMNDDFTARFGWQGTCHHSVQCSSSLTTHLSCSLISVILHTYLNSVHTIKTRHTVKKEEEAFLL